jgi:hypothetical protein
MVNMSVFIVVLDVQMLLSVTELAGSREGTAGRVHCIYLLEK